MRCLLFAAAGIILFAGSASAGDGSAGSPDVVQQALADGVALESTGHWSEALLVYQDALKHVPNDRQLIQRRSLARLHYDLERRQNDTSFLAQVQNTSGPAAQNLYSEVLLKIQSYYVEQPDWNEIARHGLTSLKFALQEPAFQRRHIPARSADEVAAAFSNLVESLNRYVVRQRSDAVWVAGHCAERLQQSLGVSPSAVIYEFICGATSALDPYSSFMSDHQYGETMSQIEGNFVGLGVELNTQRAGLEIVSVIPGGPAHAAGIRSGDRIISVGGQLIESTGPEAGADLLRGPEGSVVNVVIRRNGADQQLSLVRRRVEIPSIDGVRLVEPASGTGYIRITSFQKTTLRDFDAALWELQRAGMRSLILDLRGNPGGLLTSAVEIADRFISQGVIVSTRGRNPLEDFTHRAHSQGTWNVPLLVLIDEDSASASEILAAAIRDHRRGQIVGQTSYGKGSVQGIFPLNSSTGGMRLTTARFFSPQGNPINQVGVRPDHEVQRAARPALEDGDPSGAESDLVLQTAISLARQSQPGLSAAVVGR